MVAVSVAFLFSSAIAAQYRVQQHQAIVPPHVPNGTHICKISQGTRKAQLVNDQSVEQVPAQLLVRLHFAKSAVLFGKIVLCNDE